jgi:hypothetical protein
MTFEEIIQELSLIQSDLKNPILISTLRYYQNQLMFLNDEIQRLIRINLTPELIKATDKIMLLSNEINTLSQRYPLPAENKNLNEEKSSLPAINNEIEKIPNECFIDVFGFLSATEKAKLKSINKNFHNAIQQSYMHDQVIRVKLNSKTLIISNANGNTENPPTFNQLINQGINEHRVTIMQQSVEFSARQAQFDLEDAVNRHRFTPAGILLLICVISLFSSGLIFGSKQLQDLLNKPSSLNNILEMIGISIGLGFSPCLLCCCIVYIRSCFPATDDEEISDPTCGLTQFVTRVRARARINNALTALQPTRLGLFRENKSNELAIPLLENNGQNIAENKTIQRS